MEWSIQSIKPIHPSLTFQDLQNESQASLHVCPSVIWPLHLTSVFHTWVILKSLCSAYTDHFCVSAFAHTIALPWKFFFLSFPHFDILMLYKWLQVLLLGEVFCSSILPAPRTHLLWDCRKSQNLYVSFLPKWTMMLCHVSISLPLDFEFPRSEPIAFIFGWPKPSAVPEQARTPLVIAEWLNLWTSLVVSFFQ